MASWLNERIAKQREKKLTQEVDMAKVLLVAKKLARERKQLVKEKQKWSELHKKAIASAQKNTARIKDLLEENLKLTNSTITLEITCRNPTGGKRESTHGARGFQNEIPRKLPTHGVS
jgi:hypothetical protein